jgi:hypothetical protein
MTFLLQCNIVMYNSVPNFWNRTSYTLTQRISLNGTLFVLTTFSYELTLYYKFLDAMRNFWNTEKVLISPEVSLKL